MHWSASFCLLFRQKLSIYYICKSVFRGRNITTRLPHVLQNSYPGFRYPRHDRCLCWKKCLSGVVLQAAQALLCYTQADAAQRQIPETTRMSDSMERSTKRLIVGEQAPDFTLPDQHGVLHRFSEINRSQNVLLVFNLGFI